jgi:hypothetical protein
VNIKRHLIPCVVIGATLGVSTPASGQQLYSYSGADYSTNISSYSVRARDRESDGHPVRADYTISGSSVVDKVTEARGNGNCTGVSFARTLYKHRVVEIIPASRDDYGDWRYPN